MRQLTEEDPKPGLPIHEYWRLEAEYQARELIHRLEVQNQLGQAALRSMVLVNGGAIIGLLTFIGNTSSVVSAGHLKFGMVLFGIGLLLALLAHFGAYFSQAEFMNVAAHRALEAQARMVERDLAQPDRDHMRKGDVYLCSAIGALLLSLLAFGGGSWAALNGIL
jgi:hypothetical protein